MSAKSKTLNRPNYGKSEDWTEDEGIVLYNDKVYVPPDENLRREVIKMYHELVHMAHLGI